MPTVPMFRNRVATAPLPGAQLSADAPGAAFQPSPGLDLTAPLKVATQIDQEQRAKEDQVAVLDADNQLSALTTDLTRSALARRGTDALGASQAARDAWDKAAGEIDGTLQSPRAKEMFRQRAAARWQGLYETVERHADAEARAHDTEVTKSAINQRYNAALTAGSPEQRDLAFAELRAIITDHAKRNGESDLAPARIQAAVSRTHAGILEAMLTAGNDRSASQYYADKKDEIVPDDRLRIEKALEVGSTLGEAQRQSDAIIGTKGITRSDAFERARAIEDPKVRQQTERNLDIEFARRDRAEADQYEQLQSTAYGYVEKGQRPPAPMWAQLKPADRHSFQSMLEHAAAGTEPKTDLATYYALKRAAADPAQRDEWLRTNLLKYRDRLSRSDFEELVNAQTKVKGGQDSPLKGYLTQHDMISNAIQGLGLKNGSPERNAIEQAVDEEVKNVKRQTNKLELPDSEVQDIVDRLVVKKVYVDKAFASDVQKVAGALTTDERGNAYVKLSDIPPADANRIRSLMKANGKVPTDRAIEQAAAAAQLGDRQRFDVLIGARAKGTVTF